MNVFKWGWGVQMSSVNNYHDKNRECKREQ